MCFEVYNGYEPKVAKRDIWVWKAIKKSGAGIHYSLLIKGKFEPWTRGYEYEESDFLSNLKQKGEWKNNIGIHALHSCKTKYEADDQFWGCGKTVRMYIPKGAYYLENETQYVSNRLVFPKE